MVGRIGQIHCLVRLEVEADHWNGAVGTIEDVVISILERLLTMVTNRIGARERSITKDRFRWKIGGEHELVNKRRTGGGELVWGKVPRMISGVRSRVLFLLLVHNQPYSFWYCSKLLKV